MEEMAPGAKSACTITLEGQKPYSAMQISRLLILLGGQSHVKCFIWAALPPASPAGMCLIKAPKKFVICDKRQVINSLSRKGRKYYHVFNGIPAPSQIQAKILGLHATLQKRLHTPSIKMLFTFYPPSLCVNKILPPSKMSFTPSGGRINYYYTQTGADLPVGLELRNPQQHISLGINHNTVR